MTWQQHILTTSPIDPCMHCGHLCTIAVEPHSAVVSTIVGRMSHLYIVT